MDKGDRMDKKVVVLGGGDLASGVILRLHHCGFKVWVTELELPLVVRRTVSFAEAVYEEQVSVEDVTAKLVKDAEEIANSWKAGVVPIIIDPAGKSIEKIAPDVIIDARMLKKDLVREIKPEPLIIGLGPGFVAGENCHAVIETQRGPFMGRVIWKGAAEINSGIPEEVLGRGEERILRAPISGEFHAAHQIGDFVGEGEVLGDVNGFPVRAPFTGMIRGLIRHKLDVIQGMKLGDVDPRKNRRLVNLVSDKALAVGGGVLEAVLSVR